MSHSTYLNQQFNYHLVLSPSSELVKGITVPSKIDSTTRHHHRNTYISIEIKQWNNKQYAKRYNGTRALQIVNRRGKYTRTQEPTILKLINTSSLRPLTCVRFVVDSYDKRVWIQTDSNNFRIRQKSDSIEARKQDNENKSTRDPLHRCSTAAQQANFAIKRLHSTRLTADKQAANCRLES